MRAIVPAVLAAVLLVMPAAAQQSSNAVTADDVRALRELLQAQQQQIEQLRREMRERDEALRRLEARLEQGRGTAAAAPGGGAPQEDTLARLESDVKDIQETLANSAVTTQEDQKSVGEIRSLLDRFRWSGDVRVRYEPFFQEGTPTRHRGRMRLRLGVEGRLGEDFSGGLYVASGSNEVGFARFLDPVSTNQTFTEFFERKTIGFDRGWITYKPQALGWLELTAGKFAPTWIRTPLTFDGDLNPEGASQKFSFNIANPTVKNFTFTAMQLLFSESGSGSDSHAVGGQVSSKLQFGEWVTVTPAVSLLKWNKEDRIIAAALATGGGTLGGNVERRIQNALAPGGTRYLSGFFYSDYIVETAVKTPWKRFPFKLTLEYEDNLDAATSQGQAFWSEAALGQTKDENDFQFGYGFARVEQDAVLAAFNESDWRAQTNLSQHKLFAAWQVKKNTTAGYTLWIGRFLDPALAGLTEHEDRLKRMQFDLIYKF